MQNRYGAEIWPERDPLNWPTIPVVLGLIASTILMFMPVSVNAQMCIPILGPRWSKSYIGIYIAGGVSETQKQQTLFAMNVWYSAQTWFIDSFENGAGTPYLFYLTDKPGDDTITVSFFIAQGVALSGRAINFVYTAPPNTFVRGEIQISLPPERAALPNDLIVEALILHELGHGLGLGHSDFQPDAMYATMYAINDYLENHGLPSTLDLYAVYRLKQARDTSSLGSSVCLPASISYGFPPWGGLPPQRTLYGYNMIYPVGNFTGSFTYSIAPANSIQVGGASTFMITVRSSGDYPVRLMSASAQTDFGQDLKIREMLPLLVEPGAGKNITFPVTVPYDLPLGNHIVSFRVGFEMLTSAGWSSEVRYNTFASTFQVTQPGPVIRPSVTTQTSAIALSSVSAQTNLGFTRIESFATSVLTAIAAVFAVAIFLRFSRLRNARKRSSAGSDIATEEETGGIKNS